MSYVRSRRGGGSYAVLNSAPSSLTDKTDRPTQQQQAYAIATDQLVSYTTAKRSTDAAARRDTYLPRPAQLRPTVRRARCLLLTAIYVRIEALVRTVPASVRLIQRTIVRSTAARRALRCQARPGRAARPIRQTHRHMHTQRPDVGRWPLQQNKQRPSTRPDRPPFSTATASIFNELFA